MGISLIVIFGTRHAWGVTHIAIDRPQPEDWERQQVAWSGYVRWDGFVDSRSIVSDRDGELLYYPVKQVLECNNSTDIFGRGGTNMLPVVTRLRCKTPMAQVGCADTWAFIEGDFFGRTDTTIESFRLRHAFLQVEWQLGSYEDECLRTVLAGQYWHPFVIDNCFPGVVSFNRGVPFDGVVRYPQVRLTEVRGPWEFVGAIVSHIDRIGDGNLLEGFNALYLRRAYLPELAGSIKYTIGENSFVGAIGEFKRIMPRYVNNAGCCVEEFVNSGMFALFATWAGCNVTAECKTYIVGNANDLGMMGGYAIRCRDTANDTQTYQAMRTFGIWLDISPSNPGHLEPGIFLAYAQNLGTRDSLYIDPTTNQPITFMQIGGTNQQYLYRISPRLMAHWDPLSLGIEIEVTGAAYGDLNSFGVACNPTLVTNVRLLLVAQYDF